MVRHKADLDYFRLDLVRLQGAYGRESADLLKPYAEVFGRPIHVHRQLLSLPPFRVGPDALRLSPLDRFPLVSDEPMAYWYVPNVRGLARSAPEVVHFTLNEAMREEYELVRGELLEVYLQLMLAARLPKVKVIPEAKWPSGKGHVAGPDLLLIDHDSAAPVVMAVELKSRRMLPSTRYQLLDEDLESNFADLWKALRQLPAKMAQIMCLAGDYAKYQDDLVRARAYPVVYLGVVGEAPFMFGELVEYRRTRDREFPLYGFQETVGVMSIDTFERLIEVSVQGKKALAQLILEYLEDCANLELDASRAEDLRHFGIDEGQSFAASFVRSRYLLRGQPQEEE
jgi:hypothetical protein